jgi:uncharacterized protein (DUF2062 family)
MPRRLLRKITPRRDTLHSHWGLKPFVRFLGDPRLWSLQRRTVTPAFGAGLAIGFIPLPIHIPLAVIIAIVARINIPSILLGTALVNPLTVVPVYFLAYKTGVWVTGAPPLDFHFELSWDWVQSGLGPIWKPFLIGCAVSGTVLGLLGFALLDVVWRYSVRKRYRERASANNRQIDPF